MPDTVDVRVADGDVWVDGDHYVRGDEVTIPVGVYERIPESFTRLDADADASTADSPGGDKPETCDVVMDNDEVCGREIPCQYHSED